MKILIFVQSISRYFMSCSLLTVFTDVSYELLQHVAIKNPLAIPRAAVAPPKITPGVQMVKKEVILDSHR